MKAWILSQVMLPQDANPAGNIHGGVIMKLIDNATETGIKTNKSLLLLQPFVETGKWLVGGGWFMINT